MEKQYRVGSIVEYRPFGGGARQVLVNNKETNISGGRSGFDGDLIGGELPSGGSAVWGYDYQITKVVNF